MLLYSSIPDISMNNIQPNEYRNIAIHLDRKLVLYAPVNTPVEIPTAKIFSKLLHVIWKGILNSELWKPFSPSF